MTATTTTLILKPPNQERFQYTLRDNQALMNGSSRSKGEEGTLDGTARGLMGGVFALPCNNAEQQSHQFLLVLLRTIFHLRLHRVRMRTRVGIQCKMMLWVGCTRTYMNCFDYYYKAKRGREDWGHGGQNERRTKRTTRTKQRRT